MNTACSILVFLAMASKLSAAIIPSQRVIEGMELIGRTGELYFYLTDLEYDWDQAAKICASQNTQLASIEYEAKNEDIYGFLTSKKASTVWTSGNDLLENGKFRWASTREPFTYTHWLGSIPPSNPDCHCVSIKSQSSGCPVNCIGNYAWIEEDCSLFKRVLCQTSI